MNKIYHPLLALIASATDNEHRSDAPKRDLLTCVGFIVRSRFGLDFSCVRRFTPTRRSQLLFQPQNDVPLGTSAIRRNVKCHALLCREGVVRAGLGWPQPRCRRFNGAAAEVSFTSCSSTNSKLAEVCPTSASNQTGKVHSACPTEARQRGFP